MPLLSTRFRATSSSRLFDSSLVVRRATRISISLIAILVIAACGGNRESTGSSGGGVSSPTGVTAATATGPATATAGDRFMLDASQSTVASGTATYRWTQTAPAGASQTSTSEQPTFNAPNSIDALVFDLTVTDEDGGTDTTSIQVNVVEDTTGAYFVSQTDGDDATADGSIAMPYQTIRAALVASNGLAFPADLYIQGVLDANRDCDASASAFYDETAGLLVAEFGISVYGGFDADWRRDLTDCRPEIRGRTETLEFRDVNEPTMLSGVRIRTLIPRTPGGAPDLGALESRVVELFGVRVIGGGDKLTIEFADIDVEDWDLGFVGPGSAAVFADGIDQLEIFDSVIRAGRSGEGVSGASGVPPFSRAGNGTNGETRNTTVSSATSIVPATVTPDAPGGVASLCPGPAASTDGELGGRAALAYTRPVFALAQEAGDARGCAPSVAAAAAGPNSQTIPFGVTTPISTEARAQSGQDGCDGAAGAFGSLPPAGAILSVASTIPEFRSQNGQSGTWGAPGIGGGGGGSAAVLRAVNVAVRATIGSGGTGGAGGCGGAPGLGGDGASASAAILLNETNEVTVRCNILATGGGGRGGSGGLGQLGQEGGFGGGGGIDRNIANLFAGDGGDGGDGGEGGDGAAGQGGDSYAVVIAGAMASELTYERNVLDLGSGGQSGDGTSVGLSGSLFLGTNLPANFDVIPADAGARRNLPATTSPPTAPNCPAR